MAWTKPDFVEVSLRMEVSAYVNTDAVGDVPPELPLGTGSISTVTGSDGND